MENSVVQTNLKFAKIKRMINEILKSKLNVKLYKFIKFLNNKNKKTKVKNSL